MAVPKKWLMEAKRTVVLESMVWPFVVFFLKTVFVMLVQTMLPDPAPAKEVPPVV